MLATLNRMLRRDTLLMQLIPAIVVFIVLMIFALASWQSALRSLDVQHEKAVDERADIATSRLDERMQTSGTLLRAGNGLLYGSEFVSWDEWRRFYTQLIGDERFTGASIVGYAPLVQPADRAQFNTLLAMQGNTTGIVTTNENKLMAPVLYTTVFDGSTDSMSGYDMYSSAAHRAAMDAARDSGQIRMTRVVAIGGTKELGVAVFMPVYAADRPITTISERHNALVGFVYEILRVKQLFSQLASEQEPSFGFVVREVRDDGKVNELYRTTNMRYFEKNAEPVKRSTFNDYGRNWQVSYYASHTIVTSGERMRPMNTLVIWTGLAVIASVLVYLLIKYRTRMFALAEEQKLQQAKDELLSLASHQLRTPATGVKQYVGMVLDGFGGPVPPDQAKLLEQAYKSNERQLQIINEFLYVAKLGSGSLTTTRHKFDIAPLVRDVIEEMRLDIKENHHKVKVKVPKSVPIKADEHSVRMIIENLLSNAVKYTQAGGRIEVELRQGPRDVFISITDNGVGISKRDQKLLFKQFSRIPNELTNEVSGSGIGLYLAQQLAVRNCGKITVESEPSRGSTFTLSLPNWRVKKITIPRRSA